VNGEQVRCKKNAQWIWTHLQNGRHMKTLILPILLLLQSHSGNASDAPVAREHAFGVSLADLRGNLKLLKNMGLFCINWV